MDQDHLGARFFLVAHDEFSGKLTISYELLHCGIVAAELGSLMIAGRLTAAGGRVIATDIAAEDDDDIDRLVLESVGLQPERHTVRTWIGHLGDPLYELVARRLVAAGTLRREAGRGLLRQRTDRFPAVDLLTAAAPRLRLEHMLRTPHELDLAGGFVAALVWSLDVDRVLDPELDRADARELVEEIVANLPPALGDVVAGAREGASSSTLIVRR